MKLWDLYYAITDWRFERHNPYAALTKAEPNRPHCLHIEVSNICNANCTFCAYQHQTRPKIVMAEPIYRKAVDDFNDLGGGELVLTPVVGESLVDKNFVERVAYARSKPNIKAIELFTNGILLTRDKFEALVAAGLTRINISISGLSRDEYLRVYRVDKFDKIYQQLLDISESPSFNKIPFTLLLRTDSLFPQFKKAHRALKRCGFKFNRAWAMGSWLGAIKPEDLTRWMFMKPAYPPKKHPCALMMGQMAVFSNGTMSACSCQNYNADDELCVGSIMAQKMDAPWREGKYAAFAQRFREGNPPTPCKACIHYRPIKQI